MAKSVISQEEKNRRGEIMRAGRLRKMGAPTASEAARPAKEKKKKGDGRRIRRERPPAATEVPESPTAEEEVPAESPPTEQQELPPAEHIAPGSGRNYRSVCAEALRIAAERGHEYAVYIIEEAGRFLGWTIARPELFPSRTVSYLARP